VKNHGIEYDATGEHEDPSHPWLVVTTSSEYNAFIVRTSPELPEEETTHGVGESLQ